MPSTPLRPFQWILGVLGGLGAIFHAFPYAVHAQNENVPLLDLTTIAWLGIVVVAILLPRLQEIDVGNVKMKLRDAKASSEALQTVALALADLTKRWSEASLRFSLEIDSVADPEQRNIATANYMRARIDEAQRFLADSPDTRLRTSLWKHDATRNTLDFNYSTQSRPQNTSFAANEGLIGCAFTERRLINVADARSDPRFAPGPVERAGFRAMICVPVIAGPTAIGVVVVEKNDAVRFTDVAEKVVEALAAQYAIALRIRARTDGG